MTNEEAKRKVKGYLTDMLPSDCSDEIDEIMKALEQQPCEDCISRQKALDCFEQTNTRQGAKHAIETLPSVTPERPKGKWIKTQSGDKDFPESIVCSRCKNENSHLDFDEHSEPIGKIFVTSKYCPNCGAEMGGADETN